MKNLVLLTTLIISLTSSAQSKIDSTELEQIWNNNILPIINKDTASLSKTINFPVSGLWSMFIGFNNIPETKHSKKDFFKNIDKFITSDLSSALEKQSYKNFEIHTELDFPEVTISYGIETQLDNGDIDEGALIFSFKKIDGQWKLWSCIIVG